MKRVIHLIFCALFLSGCTSSSPSPTGNPIPEEKPPKTVASINASDYHFLSVIDFAYEDIVMLIRQKEDKFEFLLRNIFTGDEKILYSSYNPIHHVKANSNGTLFAVHEGSGNTKASIKVINRFSEIIMEKEYMSSEIQMYWNSYKENDLYVQYFQKDWTFETEFINTDTKETKLVDFDQTFFEWYSKDEIVYIAWNQLEPSLTGPLMIKNIHSGRTQKVMDEAIAFHVNDQVWTTYTLNTDADPYIEVKVQSKKDDKIIFDHKQDLTQTFSETIMIPNFDYSVKEEALYFFEPISEAEGSSEMKLLKGTAKGMVDLGKVNEAPISCSKDNGLCLVGYQLEKVYDTKTNKWYPLVKLDQ